MRGRRAFLRTLAGTVLGVLAWPAAGRAARAGSALPRRGGGNGGSGGGIPGVKSAAPAGVEAGASPGTALFDRIGLQLYTVRNAMARDFDGTLTRVAEAGYWEVEFAGYFGRTPAAVRDALERTGLDAPAAHVEIDRVREGWARTLAEAEEVGHRWLVVPSIPAEERTPDGYRAVAELLNRAGEAAREAGLRLAYHNHAFEFEPVGDGTAYDLLLGETDPDLVEFEMDLYWIVRAGGDPLAYFRRHRGRFPLVHVKDSAGPPDHRMVDVGRGVIDFRAIFAERERAGIRHCFVEHDEPEDPFATIRASHRYLEALRS